MFILLRFFTPWKLGSFRWIVTDFLFYSGRSKFYLIIYKSMKFLLKNNNHFSQKNQSSDFFLKTSVNLVHNAPVE